MTGCMYIRLLGDYFRQMIKRYLELQQNEECGIYDNA